MSFLPLKNCLVKETNLSVHEPVCHNTRRISKENQCEEDAHTADPKEEPVLLRALGDQTYCTAQNPNTEQNFHASPDRIQPPGIRTLI